MRGAVIGCGFFAQNHLNAWASLKGEGIELTAVCDQDRAKAEAAARAFGVPKAYDDAERLISEERLDFVDIVTQMASHRALARLAARRKVAAIVRKPIAPSWGEAVEIVETADAEGVRLAVHENFRFQSPIHRLKTALDSGAIGRPTFARITFRTGFDVYRNQPYFHQEKRLIILDLGIHVLDLARFFLGEVDRLSCETQRRNEKNLGEDTAAMLLRHVSGAVSVVECTYEARVDPDPFPETEIMIEGERGSLRLEPGYRARIVSDGRRKDEDYSTSPLAWAERPWHVVQESVLSTQRAITAAWWSGRDAETSGRDNLKTFALVEAAYEVAATARAVAPAKVPEGDT